MLAPRPAKSGLGTPNRNLQRVSTWHQSGFGSPRICPSRDVGLYVTHLVWLNKCYGLPPGEGISSSTQPKFVGDKD
ncbi:hypothetical protein TNCV_4045501 [Trichonephila clavipes]|nr:hypothetical protein TNCV_4045501 [Trichonephila clavipes]